LVELAPKPFDETTRHHLLAALTVASRSGFGTEADILESIDERVNDVLGREDSALSRSLEEAARFLLASQRAAERTWPASTMNDAIERAFDEINESGIVALENAGCTQSDGCSDANDLAADRDVPPRGAVFYHGQDLARGVAGEGLYLTFG